MGLVKVILSSAAKIGNKWQKIGEIVEVKSGHARNYLVPKAIAHYATKKNIANLKDSLSNLSTKHEQTLSEAAQVSQLLEGKAIALIRAASEDGRLYGSVLPRDIAKEVNKLVAETLPVSFLIEPANAQLGKGIKNIGAYNVKIVVYGPVVCNINIHICRSASEAEKLARTTSATSAHHKELT